jgi:hypothetical protein
MIWALWFDRPFIKGFTCILSYIVVSTKIVSINVPLLLIILVGKSYYLRQIESVHQG